MTHIVIIGSGFAGYELARQIRAQDQTIQLTIVTADDGGDYNKPTLSKALGFKMTPELLLSNSAEKMAEKLNATILTHTNVTKIDSQAQRVHCGDKSIDYDKLVLACGAKVNQLGLPNTLHVNSLTDYRNFYKAIQGKKHISIIGAGLVGCEMACDLRGAGYDVDMIAMGEHPMPNLLPKDVASALQNKMTAQGVRFHFDTTVENIDQQGVALNNGKTINADVVLSAIGLKPNVDLAKAADIETKRGIVTDEYLATNVDNIYALGDCAEVEGMLFQHIAPIRQSAMALAKTLTGSNTKVIYPPMMYGVKTSYYPMRVCRSPKISNDNWTVDTDEKGNAKAVHHDKAGRCDAFIFCGERMMDREGQQALVKTMANWLD